jgi:beta-galactosidase
MTTTDWPAARFPAILFGADYNPEQWTAAMGYAEEAVWRDDMRLMRLAGVNTATVAVFSWAELEPADGQFMFAWLDRLLDLLHANGIRACLATATAAQPAWLSHAYPDLLPVDSRGLRQLHGNRMNFCPTSPDFRRHARRITRALAERYARHPALLIWHVSNEYGPYCYCERCAAEFRAWLQARYGSLAALNAAWVTPFWGHTFTDWSQIKPPMQIGERSMQGLALDYNRFMSDMNLACYRNEADVLREITPGIPIMTNFHGLVKGLDYASWAPYLDIIAWDSYPPKGEPPAHVAFRHSIMRGLKGGQSWMLLEQTPSQVQWRSYNPLKRPGEMRLQSLQALAHGADAIMYFQWRQSRGSSEMHHGAIVSHAGSEQTRVFRETAALGAELHALGTRTLGARTPAEVALLFSWPNWWAVEYEPRLSSGIQYMEETTRTFAALWAHNIAVDVVSPDALLDSYKVVVAPALYLLTEEQGAALEHYVERGGTLLTTFFSGIVGADGRAHLGGSPGPLRRALGVWVEEVDPLLPGEKNQIQSEDEELTGACDLWCEVVHLEGARALATFGADYYADMPAITEHEFGAGRAYYVATRLEPALLEYLLGTVAGRAGVAAPLTTPAGVEAIVRQSASERFTFVLNHHSEAQVVVLPAPMRDLLTGAVHHGALHLAGRGVAILVGVED